MKISFSKLKSNEILEQPEVSWEDIRDIFRTHLISPTKEDVLLFSPCEFKEGATRKAEFGLRIHFGVLDLDDVTKQDVDFVREKLKNHQYIIYTTYSHTAQTYDHEGWRCRILLPFSRPVEKAEWPRFWPAFQKFFNDLSDPQCKDIGRIYYMPSHPPGKEDIHFIQHNEGIVFDVDAIYSIPRDVLPKLSLDVPDLRDLANKLKRKKSEKQNEIGEAIARGLAGKPVCELGSRDEMLFKISNQLVEEFPNHDSKSLSEPFKASIAAMQKEEPNKQNTSDWLESKIVRAQKKKEEDRKVAEAAVDEDIAFKIQLSFGEKSNRKHPYTPEELQAFADEAGTTVPFFSKRWILQRRGEYYVFHNGSYRPAVTKDDLFSTCDRYLAPAISADVSCWDKDSKGRPVKKSPILIADQYGTVVDKLAADLSISKSYLDTETNTFVQACCPVRNIPAVYHHHIAEYLEVLTGGGHNHEVLLDYLSAFLRLNEPLAAIFLCGERGTGKSSLALGLSRFWSTLSGPTDLKYVLGGFNDRLMTCPFIFVDEKFPDGFSKTDCTNTLKQLIQERTRTINGKFKQLQQLNGCVRMMLAANNNDLLDIGETQTLQDLEAFTQRFIYIPVHKEATDFLMSQGGQGVAEKWALEDHIAQHTKWLTENRQIRNSGRFLVANNDDSFVRHMTSNSGFASILNHWLISYIQDPVKVNVTRNGQIIIKDGELYVTAKGIFDAWNMYNTNSKPPTPAKIAKTLTKISTEKKSIRTSSGAKKYWCIDFENICYWAETNGYETRKSLKQKLSKNTDFIGDFEDETTCTA